MTKKNKGVRYFTYDRDQNEFETHESKEEARLYIRERLQTYVDEDDTNSLDLCYGQIFEEAFSNEQLSGVNYSDKFKE